MPNINIGFDTNFFQLLSVGNIDFTEDASTRVNIKDQQCLSFVNYGTATIEYSFNGHTLHGDMRPDTPTEGIVFDNRRAGQIWFRSPTGVTCEVRVEAWSRHD